MYHITVSLHTIFTTIVRRSNGLDTWHEDGASESAAKRQSEWIRKRDSQDSLCWLGADVHLDLDGIPHRRPGIFFREAVVYRVRSMFGRGDKGVGVDDVVGMYAGGGEGEGRVACARR